MSDHCVKIYFHFVLYASYDQKSYPTYFSTPVQAVSHDTVKQVCPEIENDNLFFSRLLPFSIMIFEESLNLQRLIWMEYNPNFVRKTLKSLNSNLKIMITKRAA